MKILVACEESQAGTIELRRLGNEAYSCDIEPYAERSAFAMNISKIKES
jgi:hypothetical protein